MADFLSLTFYINNTSAGNVAIPELETALLVRCLLIKTSAFTSSQFTLDGCMVIDDVQSFSGFKIQSSLYMYCNLRSCMNYKVTWPGLISFKNK